MTRASRRTKAPAARRRRHRARPVRPGAPLRRRHNLPAQLTSFIGREHEIAEIKRLLETTRLLTITGAGGTGKTRVALRVGADLVDHYADGAWLIELSSLSDPALVPRATASVLGITEAPTRPLNEVVADFLRSKSALLIFDNCEHVLPASAALIDSVLQACPNVRVITTSRETLRNAGEVAWRVPPMSLPTTEATDRAGLMEYEGVRLFVERAAAVVPAFTPTLETAKAIVRVCQRLDGIPLAIELAAARVRALSVEQIAARLDDRFRLLTGGSRTAVPRQQTLRAAMDWSYDLLSPTEQAVLRRASVFAGGCTLEAAEAVCSGNPVEWDDILDHLTRLVDKSLVSAETLGGEVRYRMPETIRHYAQDRLIASGEAAEVRTLHRTWHLDLAERAESGIYGPEQTMWLNRLEAEHDNLRAALGWNTTEGDDAEIQLRLVAALYRFWDYHTYWREGRRWLETALAGSRHITSAARTQAVFGEGLLSARLGDYERAMALFGESLALARELGDRPSIAKATLGRGWVSTLEVDLDSATALFEESLELFRKLDDKWWSAATLLMMGRVAHLKGDYSKAVEWCEKSLAMFRTLGDKVWIAHVLRRTGRAARLHGNLELAAGLYGESLALFGETGDKWAATECIEGLAIIASAQGKRERAARLLGAAEAAREAFGITMPRTQAGDQEHFRAAIRERPEATAFAAAWTEGRAMTLEQAIDYALTPVESGKGHRWRATRSEGDVLTSREREVAILIAQGLSNRAIAARLFISERTAETHIQHIFTKLGLEARAQIAAWVVQRGLMPLPGNSPAGAGPTV